METPKNNAEEKDLGKNYNLKSKAVEDLADDTAPEYSEEELNRYRSKRGFHIPQWLKMVFLKFWFAGAVCYFILWGLGMYLKGIDMLFVLGVVLGMVTDLLLNNVIRFMEKLPGANDQWMLVTRKGMTGFGLNLLYGCVIIACVATAYAGIFVLADAMKINVGAEPILFGLLCTAFDMLFIGMKRLFLSILQDAKNAANSR